MLVDHVLEVGGEVDLARARLRERIEGIRRQRRGAVLHRAAEAVLGARDTRELLERDQVELDVGADLAVGGDEAAVRGAGLHADLADARPGAPPLSASALM